MYLTQYKTIKHCYCDDQEHCLLLATDLYPRPISLRASVVVLCLRERKEATLFISHFSTLSTTQVRQLYVLK
jgi:hypothetical protein